MDTFETIKNFLKNGGKCLVIENGKPIGVVLTIEEYEKLNAAKETPRTEKETSPSAEENLFSEVSQDDALGGARPAPRAAETEKPNAEPIEKPATAAPVIANPIGEAMAREIDYPGASADPFDIADADADITLEDLGIGEDSY